MNETYVTHRLLLRLISCGYLLLFLTALFCSVYFLQGILLLKPIPIIGLSKYILLCILFTILSLNAARSLTLRKIHLKRFAVSTGNFKWLFAIGLVLALLAETGIFNLAGSMQVKVSYEQIGVLALLSVFCFWSDGLLRKETGEEE